MFAHRSNKEENVMKRGLVVLLMLVLLVMPHAAIGAKNPWEKELPFKNATINYTLSGMETGEEVLYIRKHGKEAARYRTTKTSMLGMSIINRSVEIMTPDWIYSFDLREGTGTRSINPQKLMIDEYSKLSKAEKETVEKNAEEMGSGIMSGMQGSLEKNAKEILGYSCDKVSVMGSTVYSIHGTQIALLTESNIMGVTVKSVATKLDKGAVPDKYFQNPEGIVPQPDPEADQMARMMAEQSISMLKDPKAFKENNQGTIMNMVPGKSDEISPEEQQQVEEAMKALKELFGN
jgi:hypothetical protein